VISEDRPCKRSDLDDSKLRMQKEIEALREENKRLKNGTPLDQSYHSRHSSRGAPPRGDNSRNSSVRHSRNVSFVEEEPNQSRAYN